MNKKLLPILLIGGAALAYLAMRKKTKRTVVEAGPTEKISEEQFYAQQPSLLDKATDVIKNVFGKTAQQKSAKQARAIAVKRAVKSGISKKKAQAVTKKLSTFSFPKIGGDEIMF